MNKHELARLAPTIAYLEALSNYTYIHFLTTPQRLYARNLSYSAELLPGFVRIHKSYLINPIFVSHYRVTGHNQLDVQVAGQWLPVSRRKGIEFRRPS